MASETLQKLDSYPNPLGLSMGVADIRIRKHPDPDFAIMTIIDRLTSEEWRILRYDCDLEQQYAHVQARRYDLPKIALKELAARLRDIVTEDEDARLCMIVIESARGQVRLSWNGAVYDNTGEREVL